MFSQKKIVIPHADKNSYATAEKLLPQYAMLSYAYHVGNDNHGKNRSDDAVYKLTYFTHCGGLILVDCNN